MSNAYFKHLAPFHHYAKITACADLDLERAKAKAAEHGVPKASTVKELLADPEIDLVLNLTIPAAHASVNLTALKAGKHAYCEKRLRSLTRRVCRSSGRRRSAGCAWAARRTRCSAAASRPAAS
ncbi:MAG: Gfo/Idh/MocA family oxidoreductase [Verrucomicrobiota bacterium]